MTDRLPYVIGSRPLQGNFDALVSRLAALEGRIAASEDPPRVRVSNSVNLTTVTNTVTALTFDTELYDSHNFHSLVTNPGRLTVPEDGVYTVGAYVVWSVSVTGSRQLTIRVNGATFIVSVLQPTTTTGVTTGTAHQTVQTQYEFAAGDYVEVAVVQQSGGNLTLTPSGFWMHRIGDLVP